MVGKVYLEPKELVHFFCHACKHRFEAIPARTEDAPDRPWHPFSYFSPCPSCEAEATQVGWERNLMKAYHCQTGPRFNGTAKNPLGLQRFNGLKHGLTAKVAEFYPAIPGKYPECKTCDMFSSCKMNKACMKKAELFMQHHIAFESGDPSMLNGFRASMQAKIQTIIDHITLTIIQDGVSVRTPKWYTDADGVLHLAEYTDDEGNRRLIEEISAHPLLKTLGDIIAKNGMTLSDSAMTKRQSGEVAPLEADTSAPSGAELREWKDRSERQGQALMKMIQRSQDVIDITPEVEKQ